MPSPQECSSEKSILIRPLLVSVLLAASLAAPMTLPAESVSALDGEAAGGGGGGNSSPDSEVKHRSITPED